MERFYVKTYEVTETQTIESLWYFIDECLEDPNLSSYSTDEIGIEFHTHPCDAGMTINFYIER